MERVSENNEPKANKQRYRQLWLDEARSDKGIKVRGQLLFDNESQTLIGQIREWMETEFYTGFTRKGFVSRDPEFWKKLGEMCLRIARELKEVNRGI